MEIFNLVNDVDDLHAERDLRARQWYNPIDLVESRRFQFGFQLDF